MKKQVALRVKEVILMRVSFDIDKVEFIGTKDDTNFDEVLKRFTSAKKIRILTYNIPNKTNSYKLNTLRRLNPDVDLRLILALPGVQYVINGNYPDYNSYTEHSLEINTIDALQKLDLKSFSQTPKIDVCFKNHAKLIGTEDILYVGSANYTMEWPPLLEWSDWGRAGLRSPLFSHMALWVALVWEQLLPVAPTTL